MSVTAYGSLYKIPSFVEGEEKSRAMNAIYDQVDRLVPAEIWDLLYARQAQYELDHEGED